MTEETQATIRDVVRSAGLAHIWIRLGAQDVRLRFRRSVLGPAWIFVNLAMLVTAIGVIYAFLLHQDMRQFLPYLTSGLIMWLYITNTIVEGGNALINSEGYIRQISLPIYVYIFRAFVSIALTMLIQMIAFALVVSMYHVPFGPGTLFAIPGLMLVMIASLLLIAIFAHLNARFRDVAQISAIGINVLFYLTPVIFPADLLRNQPRLALIVELNPAFHLIEVVRHPLVTGAPAGFDTYVAVLIVIAVLAAAAATVIGIFKRRIVFAL